MCISVFYSPGNRISSFKSQEIVLALIVYLGKTRIFLVPNEDLFTSFLLMSALKHGHRFDQNCEVCTKTNEMKTSMKIYSFTHPAILECPFYRY